MNTTVSIQRFGRLALMGLTAGLLASAGMVDAVPASAAASVQMVRDIKVGADNSNPMDLTPVGNVLFFTAKDSKGRELWKSDGTAAGTSRIKDIRTGAKSSMPSLLTNVGGTLFFVADDGLHGQELWKSDGTTAGTKMVEELIQEPDGYVTSLIDVNGTLFFFRDTSSKELWTSDGTATGTSLVKVVDPDGSYGFPLMVEGDSVFFQAAGSVWKSDGTPAGTAPVGFTDYAQWMISLGGIYYFSHYDAAHRTELWKSDGTAFGTELVRDINTLPCTDGCDGTYSSDPSKPVVLNGTMYFTAYDSEFARYLWRSDGTEAGTQPVAAVEPGDDLVVLGNKLLFGGDSPSDVDYELMRSDGTEAGTRLVKRIAPQGSYFGSSPHELTRVGNRVYFAACTEANPFGNDAECELYRTDGTKAGTRRMLDINPTEGSDPDNLTVVGGSLYFTAADGVHGRELWRYVP